MRAPEGQGKDRILIFEDTDGDGKFDKRKVFIEDLNLVSGLEVGFGGVWVGAAPYLLFIPIKDGDDMPDGPPQVLLDGWGYQDTHETLNTFTWGPDGWLYGCHGVFTHSNVGKPGTPDKRAHAAQRRRSGATTRRSTSSRSSPRARATRGASTSTTTARRSRPPASSRTSFTSSRAPATSGRRASTSIRTPTTTSRPSPTTCTTSGARARTPATADPTSAGGGHAHSGAMIYLGGDTWPAEYRDSIFMNNIHGSRMNIDMLKPKGSGYVAHARPGLPARQRRVGQMLNLRYGPDGNVYLIDWYDKNQCHSSNPEHAPEVARPHLQDQLRQRQAGAASISQKLSSDQLVELQLNRNDWYVRHARRILQERGPDPAASTPR